MSSSGSLGSGSHSEQVLELAEEFLDRYRAGERPPLREYTERHPELAAEIREVFPAMALMENIALADDSLEGDVTGDAPAPNPPALEHLGDYRILREVGRGGMGVVYEAEQVSLGRHVALKVLPARVLRDERTRRRFDREARAAAKLHHTNIVPVFGVGEEHGTPYYVMQFIQGQGLDAVLEEIKRLRTGSAAGQAEAVAPTPRGDVSVTDMARSLLTGRFDHDTHEATEPAVEPADAAPDRDRPESSASLSASSLSIPGPGPRGGARQRSYWQGVARIGEQVADALAHAHAQGIVHRDVKPSNLLLDTHGTVWIADFGLAKTDDQQDLTHSGDVLGTLRYMPPESFEGKADRRGDVYSLGLTLYELLALRPAFDEKDRGRLVRQVANETPPPLRRLNPEVPRDLETIVQKAIERDPAHRYESASELADDLRRFLDDEPIRARRLSSAERLARWGRRNPMIAGLTVALLLAMAAGTIGSTLFARRAGEQSRRATRALAAEAATRREVESTNASLTATRSELQVTLYDTRMNLAQAAWEDDNLEGLAGLLDQARPGPGETDLRGFEWYYWNRRRRGEARILPMADGWPSKSPNNSPLKELAPDGATAVTLDGPSGDQWVLGIWDTATGKARLRTRLPMPRADRNVPTIAFSGDGARLALAWKSVSDWHVRVLDVASGREEFSWSGPHEASAGPAGSYVSPVALDADGRRLALVVGSELTASNKRTTSRLKVWEVPGRAPRLDVNLPENSINMAGLLVFSPDGGTLVELAMDRSNVNVTTIRTWDVDGGAARDSARFPGLRPVGVSVRPDGRRVIVIGATAALEGSVAKLLDLAGLREVGTFSVAGLQSNTGRIYSPDGRRLVFKYFKSPVVRVIDAETGGLLRELEHPRGVFGATFSRDGQSILTLDSESVIRTWDVHDLDPTRERSRLGVANLESVVLSPDATRAVALAGRRDRFASTVDTFDDEMIVLDVSSRTPLWRARRRTNRFPDPPVFSPDGRRLGAWVRMGTPLPGPVRLSAGLPRFEDLGGLGIVFERKGDSWIVNRVVPDSAADRDGHIQAGDTLLAAGPADGPPVELSDRPSFVVRRLLARPIGTTVRLTVRARTSTEPTTLVLTASPLPPDAIDALQDRLFLIWDAATGRELVAVPPGRNRDGGTFAAFRPDGREVALGVFETPDDARYGDGMGRPLVQVHDASGRWLRDLAFPAGDGGIFLRGLVYSPDGRHLAAAVNRLKGVSATRASLPFVVVWEVATGRVVLDLQPSDEVGICQVVRFSPDGSTLAASSGDTMGSGPGAVVVWDFPSGTIRRRLVGLPRYAQGLAFTPDSRRLLTVTPSPSPTNALGRELGLWDLSSGRELLTLSSGRLVADPQFTTDGRRLIAVTSGSPVGDSEARFVVWDGSEPDDPATPDLSVSPPRP